MMEESGALPLTPPEVFQQAYNVNAKQAAKVLDPTTERVVVGPPNSNDRDDHNKHDCHDKHDKDDSYMWRSGQVKAD